MLDQKKNLQRFDEIKNTLGLSQKEANEILSINQNNDKSRPPYREVWIGLGGTQSAVYGVELSPEEYYTYTTEPTEKTEVFDRAAKLGGNLESAIRQIAAEKRNANK